VSVLNRYWNKWFPEPNTGCYIWFGHTTGTRSNRPSVFWGGKKRYVARVVCEEVYGSPFDGAEAAHKTVCSAGDACVNPDHLYWATRSQNEMDKPAETRRKNGVASMAKTLAIQANRRQEIASRIK